MAGAYGVSFAQKLIEEGNYAEAVSEATLAIGRDGQDPEAYLDRATAHAWLERYAEAIADFERALALDADAGLLETDVVDDAYFSALLAWARKDAAEGADGAKGAGRLARYAEVLPSGRHLDDVHVWARRLRGEEEARVIEKLRG